MSATEFPLGDRNKRAARADSLPPSILDGERAAQRDDSSTTSLG
jgi:hypothetical protein